MNYFLNRLTEPSTWATISAAFIAIGLNVDSGLWESITFAGSGIAGILGFILPEKA